MSRSKSTSQSSNTLTGDNEQPQEDFSKPERVDIAKDLTNIQTKVRNFISDNIFSRAVRKIGSIATGFSQTIRSLIPSLKPSPPSMPTSETLEAANDSVSSSLIEPTPENPDEPEELRKADKATATAVEQQRLQVQEQLLPEMNAYRAQSNVDNANTEGFQVMRRPQLSIDSDLQAAAEIIASELTKGGKPFQHLDDWNANWREDPRFAKIKDKLRGEMIQRGGRSARHVVMKFRDSKEEQESNRHHQFLTGDYDHAGCAVASYTDPRSGEKMFYSIVLLGAEDDQLTGSPQSVEPEKSEIALDSPKLVELTEQTTLDQMIGDRPALKAAFNALEVRQRLLHPGTSISFDLQSTQDMPSDQRQLGSFYVRIGEVLYMVTDHPPVLNFWVETEKHFQSVAFHEAFKHAEQLAHSASPQTEASETETPEETSEVASAEPQLKVLEGEQQTAPTSATPDTAQQKKAA